MIWTQDHWYLEHFWHQFGNSIFVGVATMVLTVVIGSLASFAIGRMQLRRGRLMGDAALLTYMLPTAILIIPYVHIMHASRALRQPLGGDCCFMSRSPRRTPS